jgi:hypothetical protein
MLAAASLKKTNNAGFVNTASYFIYFRLVTG